MAENANGNGKSRITHIAVKRVHNLGNYELQWSHAQMSVETTYVLASERGTSLKAAGWKEIGRAGGGSWNRTSRPRIDKAPTSQKTLWEAA